MYVSGRSGIFRCVPLNHLALSHLLPARDILLRGKDRLAPFSTARFAIRLHVEEQREPARVHKVLQHIFSRFIDSRQVCGWNIFGARGKRA